MTDSEKLNLILEMMTTFESDMQDVKQDVGGLKQDVGSLKQDVGNLKSDIQELKQDVGNLKADMQVVKQEITKINLTLDNEIRINIQRVAEGHLDLSRNLHDAIKPNNEIEMLAIRVRILESDVKELKDKIS